MAEFYDGYTWSGDYPEGVADWCNENQYSIDGSEPDEKGICTFTLHKVVPEPETPEQTQARYTQVAQNALDAFARTRGYDGIMSACSYASSTDAQFRAEAEYCVTLRDATWRRAYEILDAVIAGTMELPTEEDFLAMLPVADAHWQDEGE